MATETFTYTGSSDTFDVPPGLTAVYVELWGAQGGRSGGLGGRVAGEGPVTGGETLQVNVGGQGGTPGGGWNGGGDAGSSFDSDDSTDVFGGGGGGASDVRRGGTALADRDAVAGGGGGQAEANTGDTAGGDGGPDTGQDGSGGSFNGTSASGGDGGTQSAGGTGGSASGTDSDAGGSGSLGVGGVGGGISERDPSSGGGGGGGLYGGGGGGAAASGASTGNVGGGGAGGSNEADALSGTVTNERGVRSGNGRVEITYDSNAPENLDTVAVGGTAITIGWDAPSSANVESPANYEIHQDTSPGVDTSGTPVDTVGGGTTEYEDTGLSEETTYYYVVVAVYTNGGQGDDSNELEAQTAKAGPTGLTATTVSKSQIDLSWTPPTLESGESVEEYNIYQALQTGGAVTSDYTEVDQVAAGTTTYSDTGLDEGEAYYYRVTADVSGVFDVPDSVVYQYVAEDFASPWPDAVGSADMTVNGLTASTFSNGEDSVAGDGSSDHGLADGPEDLPENETWGLALTMDYVAANGFQMFLACDDGPSPRFHIREDDLGPSGNIGINLRDNNGNGLRLWTSSDYSGSVRSVVINKNGNGAGDISIYVDDMSSPVATTIETNESFDHTNYSISSDLGFYARNVSGSIDLHADMDAGAFEFNTEPYTESERDEFVSRRPEVS